MSIHEFALDNVDSPSVRGVCVRCVECVECMDVRACLHACACMCAYVYACIACVRWVCVRARAAYTDVRACVRACVLYASRMINADCR